MSVTSGRVVDTITELALPRGRRGGLEKVRVRFAGGAQLTLELKSQRERTWYGILKSRFRAKAPVFVATVGRNEISAVLVPIPYGVLSVVPRWDATEVSLFPSAMRHFLRRDNPSFDVFEAALQEAFDTDGFVYVTEGPGDDILDVRPAPSSARLRVLGAERRKKASALEAALTAIVSPGRAQELFDICAAQSCDPVHADAPCIPFLFPRDGCWGRAHEMCRLLIENDTECGKVWNYAKGQLSVHTANVHDCHVNWSFHVAPTILVNGQPHVIDPSLFPVPVPVDRWVAVQSDPNSCVVPTGSDVFYRNADGSLVTQDDDYSTTQQVLQIYRDSLMSETATFGVPPHLNCIGASLMAAVGDKLFIITDNVMRRVDAATGKIEALGPMNDWPWPAFMAGTDTDVFVIEGLNGSELWRVDQTTLANTGQGPQDDWPSPRCMTTCDGMLFVIDAVGGGMLWRVDPTTLVNNGNGPENDWPAPRCMTSWGGKLFVIDAGDGGMLWRVDTQSLANEGSGPMNDWPVPRCMAACGNKLFVIDGANGGMMWRVDPISLTAELNGPADAWPHPQCMVACNGSLYVIDEGRLWRVDPNSLAATLIG